MVLPRAPWGWRAGALPEPFCIPEVRRPRVICITASVAMFGAAVAHTDRERKRIRGVLHQLDADVEIIASEVGGVYGAKSQPSPSVVRQHVAGEPRGLPNVRNLAHIDGTITRLPLSDRWGGGALTAVDGVGVDVEPAFEAPTDTIMTLPARWVVCAKQAGGAVIHLTIAVIIERVAPFGGAGIDVAAALVAVYVCGESISIWVMVRRDAPQVSTDLTIGAPSIREAPFIGDTAVARAIFEGGAPTRARIVSIAGRPIVDPRISTIYRTGP